MVQPSDDSGTPKGAAFHRNGGYIAGLTKLSEPAIECPIEPKLSDFGLEDKDRFAKPYKPFLSDFSESAGVLLVVCLFVTAYFMDTTKWRYDFTFVGIANAIITFVPAAVCGLILVYIASAIERFAMESLRPKLKGVRLYNAQLVLYKASIARYEKVLQEQEARKHEAYWRKLTGIQFENEMGSLFRTMGYEVKSTPLTGDGGVDLILRKDRRKIVVQCKAHNSKVSIDVARQLVASMQDFQADEAIIACFDGVTQPVKDYISKRSIRVLDVQNIVSLQKQFGLAKV